MAQVRVPACRFLNPFSKLLPFQWLCWTVAWVIPAGNLHGNHTAKGMGTPMWVKISCRHRIPQVCLSPESVSNEVQAPAWHSCKEPPAPHPWICLQQGLIDLVLLPEALQLGLPLHRVGPHVELGLRQVDRVLVWAWTCPIPLEWAWA